MTAFENLHRPDPVEETVEPQRQAKQAAEAVEKTNKTAVPEREKGDVLSRVNGYAQSADARMQGFRNQVDSYNRTLQKINQENETAAKTADDLTFIADSAARGPFADATPTKVHRMEMPPVTAVDASAKTQSEASQKQAKEAASNEGGNARMEAGGNTGQEVRRA